MIFRSINPANEATLEEYCTLSAAEVDACIDSANKAQQSWMKLSVESRSMLLRSVGQALLGNVPNLARLITSEMGKPIAQAEAEIKKCATACEYAANNVQRVLRDTFVPTEFASSTITFFPMGIVFGIMPWNFPFWQFFRFAAAALAGGNAVLLKHAPNTPGCAAEIVNICKEGGLPDGLVGNLVIDIPDVERVIADRRIRAVTFTGSARGGSAVASVAGRYIKKTVMELGGSDAYIVLDDADLDRTASVCAASRCMNSGQSCISAKRFIVNRSIADEFIKLFTIHMHSKTVGDPMLGADVGPLARDDLKIAFLDQVDRTVAEGATASRNARNDSYTRGFFVNPVVLTGVKPGSVADTEELFGPAAAVLITETDEEAISVANASRYGLGAAVFTADSERAMRFVAELECGTVFVNDFVRSDARLPFGGVKDSGYGRELGDAGLLEFVSQKSVVGT